MSLDPKSINRLRELGRQLPKKLPTSNQSSSKASTSNNTKLHPLELEENPEKLFQELINASPDGDIPKHLIDRLKEVEALHHIKNNPDTTDCSNNQTLTKKRTDEGNLYTSFERFLLEEED